jgi:hypothetical protein
VLYAPYQSRSMIMEPRQRGQVRGSEALIKMSSQGARAPAQLVAAGAAARTSNHGL